MKFTELLVTNSVVSYFSSPFEFMFHNCQLGKQEKAQNFEQLSLSGGLPFVIRVDLLGSGAIGVIGVDGGVTNVSGDVGDGGCEGTTGSGLVGTGT